MFRISICCFVAFRGLLQISNDAEIRKCTVFTLKPSFPLLALPSVTSMLFSLLCNPLVQKDFKWKSTVIVTDKQIQKPHWVYFSFFGARGREGGCSLYILEMVVTWGKSREMSSL